MDSTTNHERIVAHLSAGLSALGIHIATTSGRVNTYLAPPEETTNDLESHS